MGWKLRFRLRFLFRYAHNVFVLLVRLFARILKLLLYINLTLFVVLTLLDEHGALRVRDSLFRQRLFLVFSAAIFNRRLFLILLINVLTFHFHLICLHELLALFITLRVSILLHLRLLMRLLLSILLL